MPKTRDHVLTHMQVVFKIIAYLLIHSALSRVTELGGGCFDIQTHIAAAMWCMSAESLWHDC